MVEDTILWTGRIVKHMFALFFIFSFGVKRVSDFNCFIE